jgi:hypothetical protein
MDVLNGWAAIPLQVIGFGLALWQLSKTKSEAVAAKNAALDTQKQIGANLLLVILPQLTQIETHLEWAVSKGDRDAAIHYLGAWRWQAGQVRGHLLEKEDADGDFMVQIQTSIATAADTKLALQDPVSDVPKRCKAAQKAIAKVTGMVGELAAKNSVERASDASI